MHKTSAYFVAPFRRVATGLAALDLVQCEDEVSCFKRGRALQRSVDGLVFFRIECSEDGDVWSEVELLAAVGSVPPEAR